MTSQTKIALVPALLAASLGMAMPAHAIQQGDLLVRDGVAVAAPDADSDMVPTRFGVNFAYMAWSA